MNKKLCVRWRWKIIRQDTKGPFAEPDLGIPVSVSEPSIKPTMKRISGLRQRLPTTLLAYTMNEKDS
jgi:hypothetical protein